MCNEFRKKIIVSFLNDQLFNTCLVKNFHNDQNSVFVFQNIDDFEKNFSENDVDIFILDQVDFIKSKEKIIKKVIDTHKHSIFLFCCTEFFNFNIFKELKNIVYDFFHPNFPTNVLVNRLNILLRIERPKINFSNDDKNIILHSLWNIIKHSSFYFLVLGNDMKIRLCNDSLCSALGYSSPKELLNKNWSEFLQSDMIEVIHYISKKVQEGDNNYQEFTNDIITRDKKKILVKWFNCKINNGQTGILSLGVPIEYNESTYTNIDSLRHFYRNVVEADRKLIESIKEIVNSQQIIPLDLEISPKIIKGCELI